MTSPSRRAVIRQMALASAGLAALPGFGWLSAAQEAGRTLIPFEDIPQNFSTTRSGTFTLPGQATRGIDLRELTSWTTAPNDLFVVTHYNVPEIDAAAWRLQVQGSAGRPLTLTPGDLRKRPRVERTVTFECGGRSPGRSGRSRSIRSRRAPTQLPRERPTGPAARSPPTSRSRSRTGRTMRSGCRPSGCSQSLVADLPSLVSGVWSATSSSDALRKIGGSDERPRTQDERPRIMMPT